MRAFTKSDAEAIIDYGAAVSGHFGELFARTTAFPQASELLQRFGQAQASVLSEGWVAWSGVDTAHNELCVAGAILGAPNYIVSDLAYEPTPIVGGRTIDFRAKGSDGRRWFVDVKTIAPELIDRWEQFETAKSTEWLSDKTELVFFKHSLGGELWHSKNVARSRMLEYTLELESKLLGYQDWEPATTILMLCGNGFHWHEDELEDFVAFYVDRKHRSDDALGVMERHFIEKNQLELPRRVVRFGYCQRTQMAIDTSRINWSVRPPLMPLTDRSSQVGIPFVHSRQ